MNIKVKDNSEPKEIKVNIKQNLRAITDDEKARFAEYKAHQQSREGELVARLEALFGEFSDITEAGKFSIDDCCEWAHEMVEKVCEKWRSFDIDQ